MMNLERYNYNGATPKPYFNTNFYSGKDVYSDGDIEDDIIKIIAHNPTTDYEKDISDNFSWPVFYHLTRIRQNLLKWYPFHEHANVLEIGCGMGAITELLCQECESVTAVELSQRRATAAYLRCREYDNLEIIVGNLNDIKFEQKYDYITLIGVLEYQNNFTDSENPFKDFLDKIRKVLKPEGKLLIAIENKYGLKYWCGVPEDHSGIPFDGIGNYKYSNVARTFSKQELDSIIKSSGFDSTYFYYPLPDYKMPQVIYSEEYLPRNGSMDNWIPYYVPNNKSMVTDEQHLYNDLINNHVFEFFANSFLVECSESITEDERITYAVASPFRNAEYDLTTVYSNKAGFCKIADSKSVNTLQMIDMNHKELLLKGLHISNTKVDNNILYTETVKGTPLTEVLTEAYKSKNKELVYSIWDDIYEEIKRSSDESAALNDIFNSSEEFALEKIDSEDKILCNAFIDMIHKNCFVDKNNHYIWIDQEWRLNDVPASYILFHNIIELHSSNEWINTYITTEEVLQHYNLIDKSTCYFNLWNVFLNTVQNRYSAWNYRQLSEFGQDVIKDNVVLLFNNLSKSDKKVVLNQTQKEINAILQEGTVEHLISYMDTLSDETILKEVPELPQFMVRYLKANELDKQAMKLRVKSYQDIVNIVK